MRLTVVGVIFYRDIRSKMILRKLFLIIPFFYISTVSAQTPTDSNWENECNYNCIPTENSKRHPELAKIPDYTSDSLSKIVANYKSRRRKLGVFLGGTRGTVGEAQHVDIEGLIGDYFSIDNGKINGGVIGVTHYTESKELDNDRFSLDYTFSIFYFPQKTVSGFVTQENLVTNLDYEYTLVDIGSYVGIRVMTHRDASRFNYAFNLGFGMVQIITAGFVERSLTPYSLPDFIFESKTTTSFSANTGVAARLNDVFGGNTLECGYRFFYLGKGSLATRNTRVANGLSTGQNYTNAFLCSLEF